MRIFRQIAFSLLMTGGIAVLMLALSGYFKTKISTTTGTTTADAKPFAGQVAEVKSESWKRFETAVGTIRAVQESAVASKILARVMEVKIKAGQPVTKDEVLVRLDDSDLTARLKQAEAAVASAVAAREKSSIDLIRAENLRKNQAISDAEFDAIIREGKSARAEEERTKQLVNEAKIILSYATIRAPMNGIVIDKRVEIGDTVVPGQVLFTVYDPTRMQLLASVRESMALKLKVGQVIPTRLDALNYTCEATVTEIVPEAQASSRSFIVKVSGPCPPGIYSGMFGRISIPLEDEAVVVVPQAAVYRVGQLDMVDAVSNNRVHRRLVQLGRLNGGNYEVLSGLRPGEKVALRMNETTSEGNR